MTGVSYFLCKVFLGLCKGIFSAISGVYALFYGLATAQFFNNDTIQAVSNNIYMFVSIVILFAFAVKLIEAIVNPDLLTDNKKGVTGVLTRTIIGLILIVAIPSIFNLVYKLQSEVITNSLVEKMILNSMDTDSSNGMSGAGGVLTSSIITGFIVPLDETGGQITEYQICKDDMSCNFADELLELNPDYEEYVPLLGTINDYSVISDLNIDKQWDNEQPIYEVNLFPLILIGLFILYQVILLCFDAGLRLVELGILQMMSPIVIVSYIAAGPEYLQKWAKLTGQKFLSVFIRIAALCLMVLGFRLMNDRNASIFNSESATFWFKVFVIIGLLRLVKELPDIISNIFGVDMKGFGGGIKGRLESMAGIGGLAAKAWGGVTGLAQKAGKGLVSGAKTAGIMAAGAVGRKVGQGAKAFDRKVFKGKVGAAANYVKSSGFGKAVRVFNKGVASGGKASAIRDAANQEFSDKIYAEQKADQKYRKNELNKKAIKASGGVLKAKLDANGNTIGIDFKSSQADIKAAGADVVANDIINGSGVDKYGKKLLNEKVTAQKEYNETKRKLALAEEEMRNKNAVIQMLENAKSRATSAQTLNELDALKEALRKDTISQADFKTRLAALDFGDKASGAKHIDSLLSSVESGEHNFGSYGYNGDDVKQEIIKLKSQYLSGDISIADLEAGLKGIKTSGSVQKSVLDNDTIDSLIKTMKLDASSSNAEITSSISSSANLDGVFGHSLADQELAIEQARLANAKKEDDYNKSKEAVSSYEEKIKDEILKEQFKNVSGNVDSTFKALEELLDDEHATDVNAKKNSP